MRKQILNKNEMADSIDKGITMIAEPVKRTLGPGGLPILIERVGQALDGSPLPPMITKDGVTVAEECQDPDPGIDLVIQTVKAICKKTNRIAGDGTTTAIVLGEAILKEAMEELKNRPELNPQLMRESIEQTTKNVIEMLSKEVTPVNNLDIIRQVATISANGEESVGEIIMKAFDAVGAEGVITVDEGHGVETTLEVVDGFQFNRGAEAQDRFFNNADATRFEAENVHIVIYDGQLLSFTPLISILKKIQERFQHALPPIVIIANEFSADAIHLMLLQKVEGGMQICGVRSPHTTYVRTAMLDDLAVVVGGTRLGNGNVNLQNGTFDDVGIAKRVIIDKYSTTIYDGAGDEEDVFKRIDQLKAQREVAQNPYDKNLISDRISSLQNGIAKIGVGGATELEVKEKYHRIEDALNASRAAIQGGILPGGGAPLYRISQQLAVKTDPSVGDIIMSRALKYPILQILINVGIDPTVHTDRVSKILHEVITNKKSFDARRFQIVDAIESGIIDPFKVTKTALENATSIAALLSTCGGGIIYKRGQ